jgi:hypothetical protein
MDGYQFIAALVSALAWPIAAVLMVALLRRSISKLLRRMRAMKYGDATLEFDAQVQQITAKVDELHETALATPQEPEALDRYAKLAALAPSLAVMEAWKSVSDAVVELADMQQLPRNSSSDPTGSRYRPISALVEELRLKSAIDSPTVALIRQLQDIRNQAAHRSDLDVSIEGALRYKEVADTIVAALRRRVAPTQPTTPGS